MLYSEEELVGLVRRDVTPKSGFVFVVHFHVKMKVKGAFLRVVNGARHDFLYLGIGKYFEVSPFEFFGGEGAVDVAVELGFDVFLTGFGYAVDVDVAEKERGEAFFIGFAAVGEFLGGDAAGDALFDGVDECEGAAVAFFHDFFPVVEVEDGGVREAHVEHDAFAGGDLVVGFLHNHCFDLVVGVVGDFALVHADNG